MKRLYAVFSVFVLLSLMIGVVAEWDGPVLVIPPPFDGLPDIPLPPQEIVTQKPDVTPILGHIIPGLVLQFPGVTTVPPKLPEKDETKKEPTITPKPQKSGQYMTSEGPLFISFRGDLTEKLYMFTPMDLSVDGNYQFPLVGSSMQVVGEVNVSVHKGITIVTYLVVNGVSVEEKNEFFTFFRDIRSVSVIEPSKMQSVKLRFGIPYSVASWLKSDSSVLLYINCPVSYKTNLKGLKTFSFEDSGYLERMMELLSLMDY